MKQVRLWMMSAIFAISGASVFTACTDDSDNPVNPVGIAIDETNFPDSDFRQFLFEEYNFAKDGVLTEAEIRNITVMDVSENEIKSLKGIEYFTALDTLDCSFNELTSLDVSKNTALRSLSCGFNELTSLDVSKNTALELLQCFGNDLTALDVSKNTILTDLRCGNNELTSLDLSQNTSLTSLSCNCNALTALDVSANTSLDYLGCHSNQLATLDVSKNMALNKLLCFKNQISGQNMDALIGSLPQNESEEFCGFYVMDGNEPNQNVCTKSQAAAAKAKGWLPQYWDEDEEFWQEYEGSDE